MPVKVKINVPGYGNFHTKGQDGYWYSTKEIADINAGAKTNADRFEKYSKKKPKLLVSYLPLEARLARNIANYILENKGIENNHDLNPPDAKYPYHNEDDDLWYQDADAEFLNEYGYYSNFPDDFAVSKWRNKYTKLYQLAEQARESQGRAPTQKQTTGTTGAAVNLGGSGKKTRGKGGLIRQSGKFIPNKQMGGSYPVFADKPQHFTVMPVLTTPNKISSTTAGITLAGGLIHLPQSGGGFVDRYMPPKFF